ncbi:MAG: FkbM family methyltransferase [Parvibaculum sp.]|uniref:FkbM family methyltransferase n=1 Tax=Parvibaculum sp. TaxID=2024848 RepID=UPI003C787EE2
MFRLFQKIRKRVDRSLRTKSRAPKAKAVWDYLAQRNCKAVLLETPHGSFWVKPGDSVIGFALFSAGEFDFNDFLQLKAAITAGVIELPDNAVFLDVGANIGTHTIYAMNSGLFNRAVCFEPDPVNFRFLEMNIHENGYGDRCQLMNMALGEKSGLAELELAPDNFGDHRIREQTHAAAVANRYSEENRKTIPVKLGTLDDTLAELGIDPASCFLHMDVQGFEPYVLRGARNFLEKCNSAFTEFWPYGMKRTGGAEIFRKEAEAQFSHFVDFGAGETHTQPIDALAKLYDRYAEGIGTTLLLMKKTTA